jgi:hypothetical protein
MLQKMRRLVFLLALVPGMLFLAERPAAADHTHRVCVNYAYSTEEMPYELNHNCQEVPENWWIECWWYKGYKGTGHNNVYYHVEVCIPMGF